MLLHSKIIGKGNPLIILHGFLGMGDNWKSLANKFSENFEVHLVDQRNHGRSFHANDFSYELLIADLEFYINHYQLDKVYLLGHSMGGKTAMLFATSYPEMVKKLIVADIAPRFYPTHHQTILEALNAVDFTKVSKRKEVNDILSNYIKNEGVKQFLLKNVYWKTKKQLAYRFDLDVLTTNIDEVGVALPSFMVYHGDTLFLKGENSGYISNDDVPLIEAHFPKATIITIANAGHWLHAENPTDFYNKVIAFLKEKL